MSHRTERLNNLLQEEVGALIHKEIEFGLGILVTVTGARVSKDTAHAKIYISIFPKNRIGSVLEVLRKNIYDLQHALNKRLKISPVPKIEFELDKGLDNAEKIEQIANKLEENQNP